MARKRRRPVMNTKEELMAYLKANKDTELPFNEEVWKIAVEKTAEKERKFKEMRTVDFDGTEKVQKIPNGAVSPVGKYFQMIALPQYSRNPVYEDEDFEVEGQDEQEEQEEQEELEDYPIIDSPTDDKDIEADEYVEDEEKEFEIVNWVNVFFTGYTNADKKFVKQRLGDYYDNYEINDGADKLIVTKAVADELEIMKLNRMRAKNKDIEKRLETVQKGYLSLLDSLKALKKQRGKMEEGKNKFTMWLDEMAKNKEFKPAKVTYDPDEIDDLIGTLTRSIVEVMRNG